MTSCLTRPIHPSVHLFTAISWPKFDDADPQVFSQAGQRYPNILYPKNEDSFLTEAIFDKYEQSHTEIRTIASAAQFVIALTKSAYAPEDVVKVLRFMLKNNQIFIFSAQG